MAEMSPRDRAQKGFSLVLQRMAHGTAKDIAKAMEVSDSDLSNLKNKSMEPCLLLLAHLGLKIVPSTSRCLDPIAFEFLTRTHERIAKQQPVLLWNEDAE